MPIGDLAVHEPDYKRLIAFLKAMEFNGLMRRVAEFSGIDPGDIEAHREPAGASTWSASPLAGEGGAAEGPCRVRSSRARPPQRRPRRAHAPAADRRRHDAAHAGERRPQRQLYRYAAGAGGGTHEAARNAKFDRSKYEAVRTLDDSRPGSNARARLGLVAIDVATASADPMQADLCGFSLAVAPNEACYVPLAHRQGGDSEGGGLFRGDRRADQIAEGGALDALKPCSPIPACSRSATI